MNTTNFNKFLFYAETIESDSFKVLIEILDNLCFKNVSFRVNKNGIFICMFNEENNIIIDFYLYGKFMDEFEFNPLASPNEDEDDFIQGIEGREFLFGISISDLKKLKIKKNDILTLSCEKENTGKIMMKITNSNGCKDYLKYTKIVQNYIIEIPEGYHNIPINLYNSKDLSKLWKEIDKNEKVKIQLKKNTLKIICNSDDEFDDDKFSNYNTLVIGKNNSEEILYEEIFRVSSISKFIKISSFGTLRIYYGEDLPLLFSIVEGSNSVKLNIYISPYSDFEEDDGLEFLNEEDM